MNPRLKKLKDFRKGASQVRHQRAMWKLWEKPGKRIKTVPVEAEPEHDFEPYSETDVIIEMNDTGSVSCRIKEA